MEHEEPIRTHKLPYSNVSHYDYYFSNGERYMHPIDRKFYNKHYYDNFSDRDVLLDNAIIAGANLHCSNDLWRVYDDAVLNYALTPINPYEWLFNHAKLSDKLIIISCHRQRILLTNGTLDIEYYDFIHGVGKHFMRYARPVY